MMIVCVTECGGILWLLHSFTRLPSKGVRTVAARFIRISQHVISDASDIDKACL